MIARPGRRPVVQKRSQPTFLDVLLDAVGREHGDSESSQRRLADEVDAIERELALDPRLELATVLFELAGPEAAEARQALVDAMLLQRLAALAASGPFGAVKEQSSGFYAQTMT